MDKSKTEYPKDDLEASISHLLHKAEQISAYHCKKALKGTGLTFRQFSILSALTEEKGTHQSDLSITTAIDRSTVAEMLVRLENRKYIKRWQAPSDRRVKFAYLTRTGRELLEEARPALRVTQSALLDGFAPNRQSDFVRDLKLFIRHNQGRHLNINKAAPSKT